MTVTFTIDGEPMGKQRPKFARQGNYTRTYTPEKTVNYETLVKLSYQSQCGDVYFDDRPISICVTAYYSIPKSASKKKAEKMLSGEILPTKKPDVDNILKIISDPCNGFLIKDDAQIIEAKIRKQYSDKPRVVVTIKDFLYYPWDEFDGTQE